MKASIFAASAAFLLSSVAAAHDAHAGFHMRRNSAGYFFPSTKVGADKVCTVYTTVFYVEPTYPPAPPAVNSTFYVYPSPVEESTTSTLSVAVPTYKAPETYERSSPAPVTKDAYTPPAYSAPAPVESSSAAPVYSGPAYSAPAPVESSSSASVHSAPAYSAPAPVESSSKAPEYSAPAYSAPAYSAPAYSAPAYSAPAVPSKPAAHKPKPSKPSTPSYSGNGRIVTKDNKWAITYTPYTQEGECKSASEVQSDIAKIAKLGFTTIRSYSTDCGVFENVVPACKEHGLKIIFGIFLETGGKGGKGPFSDYANSQLEEIKSNAPKDAIALIIVGNETIFNGYTTAEELASYIDYVRKELQGAGFPEDIAVTTTEPVDVWEEKGAPLCGSIDIFACQVHPFFTSKISASDAGDFAAEQLEKAAAVCPEAAAKGKYITEIGWPKAGDSNGNAVPGYGEQKEAIKSILEKVGKEACIFSFQDDHWKDPGAFHVEQNFGASDALPY